MATVQALSGTSGTNSAYASSGSGNDALSSTDFLNLIITELKNQDYTNATDTSAMVDQMSQFSMVSAMEEMSKYSQLSYASSLLGKTLTVSGSTSSVTGTCDKVAADGDTYKVYIGDNAYTLSQIEQVQAASNSSTTDSTGSTGGTSGTAGSSDTTSSTSASTGTGLVQPQNYDLSAGTVTQDSAAFSWQAPSEDTGTAAGLTYTVYYTPYNSKNAFNTVDAVTAGKRAGSANQTGTTATLSGLSSATNYWVNVVVTDASGNRSVFQPITIKTESSS